MSKQKLQLSTVLVICAMSFVAFFGLLPSVASAQSSLQSTTTGLQPQTAQTQPSASSLGQTGAVQNNESGVSALSQNATQQLSVVSDPRQTTPDAVVAPSQTLATEITEPKSESSLLPLVIVGSLVVIAASSIIIWREDNKYN